MDMTLTGLQPDEVRLLRAFRAMGPCEQDSALSGMSRTVLERIRQANEEEETLEDMLLFLWPSDWPEPLAVDPSWAVEFRWRLQEFFPGDDLDSLLGLSDRDGQAAEYLAEEYLQAADEQALPLVVDFGVPEEEMHKDMRQDFVNFIREWREQMLAVMEKARPVQRTGPGGT